MAITGRLYSLARQEQDIMQDAQFRSMIQESKDTGAVIIDGRNIAAGSIYSHQLHAESVTADKIKGGAITGDHIEAYSIGVDKLVASDLLLPGEVYGGVRITQDGLTMSSTGNAGVTISLSSETGLNITDKYNNPLIDIDPDTGRVTMQVESLTVGGYTAATEEAVEERIKGIELTPGPKGDTPPVGHLTNESITVYTDANGKHGDYTQAVTEFVVYEGSKNVTNYWGVDVNNGAGIDGHYDDASHTYKLNAIGVDNSRVIFTASKDGYEDIVKVLQLHRVKQAKDGRPAETYLLNTDEVYIKRDVDTGAFDPSRVTFSGQKSVAGEAITAHPGYFVIYEKAEGAPSIETNTDWVYRSLVDLEKEYAVSDQPFPYVRRYTSEREETEVTYTPTPTARSLHIEWYADSDLTDLLDIEQIPVIEDGEDSYRVEVLSTNGNTFKNGVIDTWIYALVYKGDTDITSKIDAGRFRWTRTSIDSRGDEAWNARYDGGVKEIKITTDDVYKRATFTCEIRKQ